MFKGDAAPGTGLVATSSGGNETRTLRMLATLISSDCHPHRYFFFLGRSPKNAKIARGSLSLGTEFTPHFQLSQNTERMFGSSLDLTRIANRPIIRQQQSPIKSCGSSVLEEASSRSSCEDAENSRVSDSPTKNKGMSMTTGNLAPLTKLFLTERRVRERGPPNCKNKADRVHAPSGSSSPRREISRAKLGLDSCGTRVTQGGRSAHSQSAFSLR